MTKPFRSDTDRDPDGPTLTHRLSHFITSARVRDEVVAEAVTAMLDTLAVTIAGGIEPGVRRLAASLEPQASASAIASFWDGDAYRWDDAALLFGMASHVLDYDDVSMLSLCHPSAPVLSALLATPSVSGSGRDLAAAFAIGTEVLIRLGQIMGFRHYALGFHATATLGTIGAAAACARLMRLDVVRTGHALAIAASLAGGLRKNFGTNVKALHVGIAAANGLKAARLAAAGIEGAYEAFEEEGFLHAFSGGETDRAAPDFAFGAPFALLDPGFEQKRYPCCYMLHKMIEGTLALRRDHALDLAAIRSARIDMPAGGTRPLIHPFPKSGLNGLFSAPYAVSASLTDGRMDLKSFTDEAVLRPQIQARLGDISVVEAPGPSLDGNEIGKAPVTVTLTTIDGDIFSRTILPSPGSKQDPLTPAQQKMKWVDCLQRAQPCLPRDQAASLFEMGLGLSAHLDHREWLAKLRISLISN